MYRRTLGDEIPSFWKPLSCFVPFPHNRRNLHYVDRLCHAGRRGGMYFWDEAHKRGTIHATSAKASPGSRQGVSVHTGQLGSGEICGKMSKLLWDKHGFPGGAVRMRHLARQLLLATSIKGDGRSERRQRVLSLLQTHDADTTPRPLITARRTSHDSRHIFLLWLAESRLQTECSHNPILIILLIIIILPLLINPNAIDNYTPADYHLVQESNVEHCPTPWWPFNVLAMIWQMKSEMKAFIGVVISF